MKLGLLPDALKVGAFTALERLGGFMAFRLARCTRTVLLVVPV
jgi:hypothetical protein